jgi:hypothetical protein
MIDDPHAQTLTALCCKHECQLWLRETSEGYRLNDELFAERRDASHAWMRYAAALKGDDAQIHEYSLYGWMTAAGTPG